MRVTDVVDVNIYYLICVIDFLIASFKKIKMKKKFLKNVMEKFNTATSTTYCTMGHFRPLA